MPNENEALIKTLIRIQVLLDRQEKAEEYKYLSFQDDVSYTKQALMNDIKRICDAAVGPLDDIYKD